MSKSNFSLTLIKAAKQKEQRLKQAQMLLAKKSCCAVAA